MKDQAVWTGDEYWCLVQDGWMIWGYIGDGNVNNNANAIVIFQGNRKISPYIFYTHGFKSLHLRHTYIRSMHIKIP